MLSNGHNDEEHSKLVFTHLSSDLTIIISTLDKFNKVVYPRCNVLNPLANFFEESVNMSVPATTIQSK